METHKILLWLLYRYIGEWLLDILNTILLYTFDGSDSLVLKSNSHQAIGSSILLGGPPFSFMRRTTLDNSVHYRPRFCINHTFSAPMMLFSWCACANMAQSRQYWCRFYEVGGRATDAGQPNGYRLILLNEMVLTSVFAYKTKQKKLMLINECPVQGGGVPLQ